MKTLKELVVEKKCRKGPAFGTTKNGAFWMAVEPIKIRGFGGDGVGNNPSSRTNYLQLRHYRDGAVKAVVNWRSWHQNAGDSNEYVTVDILDCITIEEVVVSLKKASCDGNNAYSDRWQSELTGVLLGLGMCETLPSPDDDQI
jgi:hypothetical protein